MCAGMQSIKFKILFTLLAGITVFCLLQFRYEPHLFFLEQYQLFLSGKEYAGELLSRPGGLMEYLSEYCIQFFGIKYVGSICITVLLLLIATVLHLLFRKDKQKEYYLFIGEGSIIFFLLINILDIAFYLRGIVGFLFCAIALLVYKRSITQSFNRRLLTGISLALILFWIAAPFQTLFLITASCMELRQYGLNKGKSFVLLALVLVSGYLAFSIGGNAPYRSYIALDGICYFQIIPGWTKYAAWVLLPVAVLLTPFLEWLAKRIKKNSVYVAVQGVLFVAAIIFVLPKYDDHWSLNFKQLNHYAVQNDWDNILAYCKKHKLTDYGSLNYQNLALAEKGILADSLLVYQQRGKTGLFAPWDRTAQTAFALQKICYDYGEIAFAQKFAFEGNVISVTKGYPETMKTLIRTNLLQKEYRVAAKYINYMRQTFAYKEWADKQYGYILNPEAMENDPEYKDKLSYFQKEGGFLVSDELFVQARQNKGDRRLSDFVLCSFLLDKDLPGFLMWFDHYYANIESGEIPRVYYEAVMACAPNNPGVETYYKVPEDIKEHFEIYASVYSNIQNPKERKEWLTHQYATSYWFYYHYAGIDHE